MRITRIRDREEAAHILSKTIKEVAEELHTHKFEVCIKGNNLTITFLVTTDDDSKESVHLTIEETIHEKLIYNIKNYEGDDEECISTYSHPD